MVTDCLCDDSEDIDEERDVDILLRTYTLMGEWGFLLNCEHVRNINCQNDNDGAMTFGA